MTTDAFYERIDDDRFRSTAWTTGPWDPRSQHGGPPAALLGRALDAVDARDDVMLARATFEILRPVPVADLTVSAHVVRPGRRVEFVEATLSAADGDVIRASGWRIARTAATSVAPRDRQPPALPAPRNHPLADRTPTPGERTVQGWVDGYVSAVEWRAHDDNAPFSKPGPASYWTRLRIPLIAGETPTGLQRLLVVADSGSGISAELDLTTWLFINPELTVHLHREPVGEWICLDAMTTISAHGCGMATSVLSDLDGPVGNGAQSLLVAPRTP